MGPPEKKLPYVILIGNVGAGKSTLVDKITNSAFRSSTSSESATRNSEVSISFDNKLLICDTPGANPMEESFQHNMWIAQAMNFREFNRLMIVVKADTRIDTVIDHVEKYAQNLLDLEKVLTVCVTHMDQVSWGEEQFLYFLDKKFGLKSAVFTGTDKSPEALVNDICKECSKADPVTITVDHDNFFKYFKVGDSKFKILKSIKKEVDEMLLIKNQYFEYFKKTVEPVKTDLMFEFQTWIKQEMIYSQQRVSSENNFTFMGENTGNEAGHIASLTNQLRSILYEVKLQVYAQQPAHGVMEARECPYCSKVWTKVEGCDGVTTCGSAPSKADTIRRGMMCHFRFTRNKSKLTIERLDDKDVKLNQSRGSGGGCQRQITWSEMKIIPIPSDCTLAPEINTDDLDTLHQGAKNGWKHTFTKTKNDMKVGFAGETSSNQKNSSNEEEKPSGLISTLVSKIKLY